MYGKHLWRVSQECHQSNLIDGASFFSQWYFTSSGRSGNEKIRDYCKLSFPVPLAARLHILSSLTSLINTGLASRLQNNNLFYVISKHFLLFFTCFLMLALLKKGSSGEKVNNNINSFQALYLP